jgi:hypothetical protein
MVLACYGLVIAAALCAAMVLVLAFPATKGRMMPADAAIGYVDAALDNRG